MTSRKAELGLCKVEYLKPVVHCGTLAMSLSQQHLHFNLDREIAHFPSHGVVNHPLVMEAKGLFL